MDTSLYLKKIKNKVTKKAQIFDRLPSLCTLRACNSGASNEGMQHLFEHGHTPNSYCTKKNQLILRGSAGRSSLICQCEGVHFYCTTRWQCLLSSHVQTLDSYATDFCCCFFFKMSEIRSLHYLYPTGFLKFIFILFCLILCDLYECCSIFD